MVAPPTLRFLSRSLALLVLAAGSTRGLAQIYPLEQPPQALTLPQLRFIDLNVQGERSTSSGGGSQLTYQQLYVAPTVGIGWDYYLYHPDLLTFSLLAQPGYVWQSFGSSSSMAQENDLLLNGHFNATLLQLKPYYTTFFVDSTHDTRQYDFFSTVVEDTQNYGVTTGYREGAVPFTIAFQQGTTDSSGMGYDSTLDQTSVSLHAMNERGHGNYTDLVYQYQNFDWSQSGADGTSSSSAQTATVTDVEHLGKGTLNSSLLFSDTDYSGVTADNLNLTEDFSVEHTPHLRSFYDYGLADYTIEGGSSLQNTARAGLEHQLYQSLASTFDLHGATYNSDYSGASLDDLSAGSTISLNYSKKLGDWGHLTLGNAATYDFTQQQSSGGILTISQESHQVANSLPVLLGQLQAVNDGNFLIIDKNTGYTLMEGTDYTVNRNSNPWQFTIIALPGPHFQWGDTFLVTYDIQSNPSGSYTTFNEQAQARLDFWDGLMDVHVRYNYTDNEASSSAFVLQNLTQIEAGTDFNWKRLRLTADYIDSEATLFDYYSYATTESCLLLKSLRSSLSVDCSQEWTYYPGRKAGQNGIDSSSVTFYNYMLRYTVKPTSALTWRAEVGWQQQNGAGLDQELFAARTYLDWSVGRLNVNLGYEYQDQQFQQSMATSQSRNYAFLRLRRNF